MKTVLTELIEKLEFIKENNCKTLQEVVFFDGVLAVIDAEKFVEKEKRQIKLNWIEGKETEGFGNTVFEDAEIYYNRKYSNET